MMGEQPAQAPTSLPWPAPSATGPVQATVNLPGSKSITNRALVLAALADGPGLIRNPLRARDTLLMARALASLGSGVDDIPPLAVPPPPAGQPGHGGGSGPGVHPGATPDAAAGGPGRPDTDWRVTPGRPSGDTDVDVGNAGTVMRFIPPVAALTGVNVAFHGDARASQRPVGPLLAALRELGAVIDDDGRGAVPFTVRGAGSLTGGAVSLDASASSQFVSGLLLAAPRYDKGVEVRHEGDRLPSAPLIGLTVRMLREAGATVETACRRHDWGGGEVADTWRVLPGVLRPRTVTVEPDIPNAAPFLAAALVTGGTVQVPGWPRQTAQPAGRLLELLTEMGADCALTSGGLTVTGRGAVHGITADLGDVSEFTPVLTALAALADSPSRLTGIAHMRRHETDRLTALATEINALGGDVAELPGGLVVRPRPLRGGVFASYDDHRLVMCAAVLGLAVAGVEVENAATVGKTFPEFGALWSAMLGASP